MSTKTLEAHELSPCVSCGERLCFHRGYGPEFGLCSQCAEAVANLYWKAHTGDWLTWDRQERAAGRKNVPAKLRWEVLRRDGFQCKSCGENSRPMHVDHITPRSKGGTNDPENLQTLCDKCNLKKGAK